MLNNNLTINGQRISNEENIPAFFQSDHFSCMIDDYCLEVEFSPDGDAFIGWLNSDEEIYYFDNGSGNTDSVPLRINICPEERMMCYDRNVLKDIVMYFAKLVCGIRNTIGYRMSFDRGILPQFLSSKTPCVYYHFYY